MRKPTAIVFFIVLSGCASQRLTRDPLCQELAAFANAARPGETHVVSLETAWGPTRNAPDALSSLACLDGGYPAGARLCRYLLKNSATEFPTNNFHAAFACLSGVPQQTKNFVTYERLEARVSANGAVGVREQVEVWLEFKPNTVTGTMQLDIGVTAAPAAQ
ncbi:MAG: hypothetical protein ABI837_14855 [Acidobacteriota bacterium]